MDLGEAVSSALAERAAAAGVHIGRGARFGVDPGTFEHRLRIPYTLPADRLDEGVRRLASVVDADGEPESEPSAPPAESAAEPTTVEPSVEPEIMEAFTKIRVARLGKLRAVLIIDLFNRGFRRKPRKHRRAQPVFPAAVIGKHPVAFQDIA